VALMQLRRVAKTLRKLDRTDPDTLHDFRVALRRFRSILRAYRDVLETSGKKRRPIPKRVRRTLRRLAHATDAGRDLDVQLEWLEEGWKGSTASERAGTTWLWHQLKLERDEAGAALDAALNHQILDAIERLESYLGDARRRSASRAQRNGASSTLARVTAEQAERLASELTNQLAMVTTPAQHAESHRARISAKRLRYLLEPFARDTVIPGITSAIAQLKGMQDALGEQHDVAVFLPRLADQMDTASHSTMRTVQLIVRDAADLDATEFCETVRQVYQQDPMPGLVRLSCRLRERQEVGYAHVQRWLGARAADAMADVRNVVARFPIE